MWSLSSVLFLLLLLLYTSAAPATNRTRLTSEGLQRAIKLPRLVGHAHKFASLTQLNGRHRFAGSRPHNAVLEYLKAVLDETGIYDTEYQAVPFPVRSPVLNFTLGGQQYPAFGIDHCPEARANGTLHVLANTGCEAGQYDLAVRGKILLLSPEGCAPSLKVALAGSAGATGVLFVANVTSGTILELDAPSRPEGPYVPCGAISDRVYALFRSRLQSDGNLPAQISLTVRPEVIVSNNLFATSKMGDRANQIVVGAHSDSVRASPGMNDNLSGTLAMLELAIQLNQFTFNNAIRFAWWTAEEVGLYGSTQFTRNTTKQELDKIALYLNVDMIAAPNPGFFVLNGNGSSSGAPGPAGSGHIQQTFERWFANNSIKTAPVALVDNSDHWPFLQAGIPVGGVFSGGEEIMSEEAAEWWQGQAGIPYDPCYHFACDDVDNINNDAWYTNTKAIAHTLSVYLNNLDGINRTHVPSNSSQLAEGHRPGHRHSAPLFGFGGY